MRTVSLKFIVIITFIAVFATGCSNHSKINRISFADGELSDIIGSPKTTIINQTDTGIELEYTIPGMEFSEIYHDDELFHILHIDDSGHMSEAGKPELPLITKFIEIPLNHTAAIEITDSQSTTLNGYNIYPYQLRNDSIGSDDSQFYWDSETYSTDQLFPSTIASLGDSILMRGHKLVPVIINPVLFNPVTRQLQVYSSVKIKVTYQDSGTDNDISVAATKASQSIEKIVESIALNYTAKEVTTPSDSANSADYLIVTHDDFIDAAQLLAAHKESKGLNTKIVKLSDIGTNPSADEIRNHLVTIYRTWNPAPTYVVLIGDHDYIPMFYRPHTYQGGILATDLYYAAMDGDSPANYPDYCPDVFLGRLPVTSTASANTVVNKIISYESDTTYREWKKKILLAAYYQDEIINATRMPGHDGKADRFFLQTSEEERQYLSSNTDFDVTTAYTYTSGSDPEYFYYGTPLSNDVEFLTDSAATAKIVNTINDGVVLVSHRDHGATFGWGHPYFTTSHISSLTNIDKLPVMFSINCESGRIDDSSEGFGERLLESSTGGVIGFIGASRVSYSGYNDEFSKGLFDGLWNNFDPDYSHPVNDNSNRLGVLLNYAKMYMYIMRPQGQYPWSSDDPDMKVEFELFNLLGDPELSIGFIKDIDTELAWSDYRLDGSDKSADLTLASAALPDDAQRYRVSYTINRFSYNTIRGTWTGSQLTGTTAWADAGSEIKLLDDTWIYWADEPEAYLFWDAAITMVIEIDNGTETYTVSGSNNISLRDLNDPAIAYSLNWKNFQKDSSDIIADLVVNNMSLPDGVQEVNVTYSIERDINLLQNYLQPKGIYPGSTLTGSTGWQNISGEVTLLDDVYTYWADEPEQFNFWNATITMNLDVKYTDRTDRHSSVHDVSLQTTNDPSVSYTINWEDFQWDGGDRTADLVLKDLTCPEGTQNVKYEFTIRRSVNRLQYYGGISPGIYPYPDVVSSSEWMPVSDTITLLNDKYIYFPDEPEQYEFWYADIDLTLYFDTGSFQTEHFESTNIDLQHN